VAHHFLRKNILYIYSKNVYKGILTCYLNMKIIKTILERFITKDKKILGRWNIEYCDKKMNHKIDLSNEDHCGPCGQYILDKSLKTNDISKVKKI